MLYRQHFPRKSSSLCTQTNVNQGDATFIKRRADPATPSLSSHSSAPSQTIIKSRAQYCGSISLGNWVRFHELEGSRVCDPVSQVNKTQSPKVKLIWLVWWPTLTSNVQNAIVTFISSLPCHASVILCGVCWLVATQYCPNPPLAISKRPIKD